MQLQNLGVLACCALLLGLAFWRSGWLPKALLAHVRGLATKRVPYLTGLALFGVPFLLIPPAGRSFTGAFYDLGYAGTAVCVFFGSMCAWSCSITHLLMKHYAGFRFGEEPPFAELTRVNPTLGDYLRGFILTAPMLGAIIYTSVAGNQNVVFTLRGAVLGYVLAAITIEAGTRLINKEVWLLDFLDGWLRRLIDTFDLKTGPGAGAGYLYQGRLAKGHRLSLRATLVFAVFYVAAFLFEWLPSDDWRPTLAYILILLTALNWVLSGITFFLDRYRVPLIVPLILWFVVFGFFKVDDHFYHLPPAAPSSAVTPASDRDTLVVVAASGGGIQAAAWTARVIEGLSNATGGRFTHDLDVISSASGGSLGAMYVTAAYDSATRNATPELLRKAVTDAEASSLSDVAWGLVYPDLWHAFVPLCYGFDGNCWDRGVALERSWGERLDRYPFAHGEAHHMRAAWKADAVAGARPGLLLNATVVDTGQPLVFGTIDLPVSWTCEHQGAKPCNSENLLPGHDLAVETATRLSAAFPYVSPAARADDDKLRYHLVDGGYYDDFGITSLVQWVDERIQAHPSIRCVLFVEIRASGAPPAKDAQGRVSVPGAKSSHGWLYQATAPLLTLSNARDTGQRSGDDQQFALLKRALWKESGVETVLATFEFGDDNTPESWRLLQSEKDRIEERWRTQRAGVDKVCQFFHAPGGHAILDKSP